MVENSSDPIWPIEMQIKWIFQHVNILPVPILSICLYAQTQTSLNWSVKPSSRVIIGLNFGKVGKLGFFLHTHDLLEKPGIVPQVTT